MKDSTAILVKSIDKRLKDRFKAACSLHSKSMSAVLIELMQQFVDKTFSENK